MRVISASRGQVVIWQRCKNLKQNKKWIKHWSWKTWKKTFERLEQLRVNLRKRPNTILNTTHASPLTAPPPPTQPAHESINLNCFHFSLVLISEKSSTFSVSRESRNAKPTNATEWFQYLRKAFPSVKKRCQRFTSLVLIFRHSADGKPLQNYCSTSVFLRCRRTGHKNWFVLDSKSGIRFQICFFFR